MVSLYRVKGKWGRLSWRRCVIFTASSEKTISTRQLHFFASEPTIEGEITFGIETYRGFFWLDRYAIAHSTSFYDHAVCDAST